MNSWFWEMIIWTLNHMNSWFWKMIIWTLNHMNSWFWEMINWSFDELLNKSFDWYLLRNCLLEYKKIFSGMIIWSIAVCAIIETAVLIESWKNFRLVRLLFGRGYYWKISVTLVSIQLTEHYIMFWLLL